MHRQPVARMNGGKHQIGTGILFIMEQMIGADNEKTAKGQQQDKPWILQTQACYLYHKKEKQCYRNFNHNS